MTDAAAILAQASKKMEASFYDYGGINLFKGKNLPTQRALVRLVHDFMHILFPGYYGHRISTHAHLQFFIQGAMDKLFLRCKTLFFRALQATCEAESCASKGCETEAEKAALSLLSQLPELRQRISRDVLAGYDGDPAATSTEEVILCYPFVYAIAVHRIAHEIYNMQIPLVARMMSEWSHHRTGIDIHPGAAIGDRFFIDHGTGVVIGETAEIGDNVKLYQGVTLGALSFPRNPDGSVVKGGKRHPTIRNDVTIYAGATILGGETVIGEGCVIGANTWITESVPAHTLVTFKQQQRHRQRSR